MKTTLPSEKFACPRRQRLRVDCVANDYADTQFSNFAIKYLRENGKVCKIVFVQVSGIRTVLQQAKDAINNA